MNRGFQKHTLTHGVLGIVWMIGVGIVSPFINSNITIEKSLGISVVTVFLMLGLFRIMRGLSPFDKKNAILVGCFFGGIAGLGVGTIVGWGGVFTGGAFGLGLVPWILGSTVLLAICEGYSLSMPARMLTDNTPS